jgi:hypothetical protein
MPINTSQTTCPHCDCPTDPFGDHLLCCNRNNFTQRHNAVQNVLLDALKGFTRLEDYSAQSFLHLEPVVRKVFLSDLLPARPLRGWLGDQRADAWRGVRR